jgi:metal-dependent amidase/aminoacylase/carboxypeptidase family protein
MHAYGYAGPTALMLTAATVLAQRRTIFRDGEIRFPGG